MADSFLDSAGGFTPVPDKLVREYDFTTAYVWGKVWRYCQMQNGACTASHETIAKRAGMSRRTLIDKLNILIEAGYIEDQTPDLKNKPHTYCTRIGEDKITSAMQISHTEIDIPAQDNELGMRNLHSDNADNAQSDNPTMQNLHSESAKDAQPAESTMQNLHLKKEDSSTTTKEGMNQIGDLCKEHFSDPAVEPYRTQLLETINRYSAVKVLWAIQTALSPDRQNGKAKSWGYVLGILEKDERRSSNQQALAARPRSKDKSPPISEAYRQLLEEDKTQVYNPLDRS